MNSMKLLNWGRGGAAVLEKTSFSYRKYCLEAKQRIDWPIFQASSKWPTIELRTKQRLLWRTLRTISSCNRIAMDWRRVSCKIDYARLRDNVSKLSELVRSYSLSRAGRLSKTPVGMVLRLLLCKNNLFKLGKSVNWFGDKTLILLLCRYKCSRLGKSWKTEWSMRWM